MHRRWTAMLGLAALAIVGCHEPVSPRTEIPPNDLVPLEGRFDAESIRSHVAELSTALELDGPARVQLREKLDTLLADDDFTKVMRERGVQAVGVYRWGEGGVVVKLARGDGTVRFAGRGGDRRFDLELTTIGAQVGGSAAWGVMLGLGLPSIEAIEGSYEAELATATGIDRSAGTVRLVRDGRELYFVGIAEGLSANAGGGTMVVALRQ